MQHALRTSRQEETLIRLPRGGLLATVEDHVNGLLVKSERIRTDELIFSLMTMLDDADIRRFLVRDGQKQFSLLEIFGPLIESSSNTNEVNQVFKLFLQRFGDESDRDIILRLFYTFTDNIDVSSLSEQGLNQLLSQVMKRVEGLEDSKYFDHFLTTLLGKIDISNSSDDIITKVYRSLLEGMNRKGNEKLLRSMFSILINKLDQNWIFEYLRPFMASHRLSSPLLPRNCILYQENGAGCRTVAIEVEKQRFNVQFGNDLYKNVGYPKLVFVFKVFPGSQMSANVLTVTDKVIGANTEVFYYPYSNVQHAGRSMQACWPELNKLGTEQDIYNNLNLLSTLPFLFLNSPSNNDLYKYENLRDRFIKFSGKDFDDGILESTGATLADYLNLPRAETAQPEEDELEEDADFDESEEINEFE
ncbi:hypothetical protein [Paenibacillus sp. GYB003]|uniref:hypothetical protein n=1 Tax=Paenibacillus sp. GYB003 TaxID=2994392 RepID=UPI002F96CA54